MTRYTKSLLAAAGLAVAFSGGGRRRDQGGRHHVGFGLGQSVLGRGHQGCSRQGRGARHRRRSRRPGRWRDRRRGADRDGRGPDREGSGRYRDRARGHRGSRTGARAGAGTGRACRVHRQARRHAGNLHRDGQHPRRSARRPAHLRQRRGRERRRGAAGHRHLDHRPAPGGGRPQRTPRLRTQPRRRAAGRLGRREGADHVPRTSSPPTPICGRSSPRTTTWRSARSRRSGTRSCWTR